MIDFHTHAFVDKLAARALTSLSISSGGLEPHTDGTVNGLLASMDACGVEHAVLLNIATKPTQQTVINNWAAQMNGERLSAFGSVHPDAPDIMDELERIHALGLKGVKFHPEYQHFYVDEARMLPIYRKIASLGLITVFHAGADLGFEGPVKAAPLNMARALSAFDGAPVVAAHFGGYMLWEDVLNILGGLPLYFDTSFCFGRIPWPTVLKLVERHGPEKLLFGTDTPWSDAHEERKLIELLPLTPAERQLIYHDNAARLLKLN